ncbi:MAG: hypothetical protein KDB27_05385 [Planctomycetales bacterium]|nr:hypothetical protein [Planctomycetales bacterium]
MKTRRRRLHLIRTAQFEYLEARMLLTCALPVGDFNSSASYDASDIDTLSLSVQAENHDPQFDLDDNGPVDQQDRRFWVEQCAETYFGDANLDGRFDGLDLIAWDELIFEQGTMASWSDGDFDGDADFDRFDVIKAFQTGVFASALPDPVSALTDATPIKLTAGGAEDDGVISLEYVKSSGLLLLRTDRVAVSAISLESQAGHLLDASQFPGDFSFVRTDSIFITDGGSDVSTTVFSMTPMLTEAAVLADIAVSGAKVSGGNLGQVDLIYRDEEIIDLSEGGTSVGNFITGNLTNTVDNWYRWEVMQRGRLSIGLFFDQANGDAELELYRGRELLKWSATTQRAETIEWEVVPEEVYYIRVVRDDFQTAAGEYELSVQILPESPRVYALTGSQIRSYDPITLSENTQERIDVSKSLFQHVRDIEIGPTGLIYVSLDFRLLQNVRADRILEYMPMSPDRSPVQIPVPSDAAPGVGFDVLEDGTFIIPAKAELKQIIRFDRQGKVLARFSTGAVVPRDVTVTRSGQIVFSTDPTGDGFQSFLSPAFDGGSWRYVYRPRSCRGLSCVEESLTLQKSNSNNDRTINLANRLGTVNHVLDLQETMDGSLFYVTDSDLRKRNAAGSTVASTTTSDLRALAVSNGEFDVRVPFELSLDYEFSTQPDRDGDGLLDKWEEEQGIDVDGDGVPDVPLPNADPNHKDIYVEVDALMGHAPAASNFCATQGGCSFTPTNTVLDRVIQAFADVPPELVYNPDGLGGIRLHIDLNTDSPIPTQIVSSEGQAVDLSFIPEENQAAWSVFNEVKRQYAGTTDERNSGKSQLIYEAREKAYRYALFADKLGTQGIAGMADQPGRNLMVTLGDWNSNGGTPEQQATIFMHELGHTLGLGHGGGDDINYKPNYLSVMSYSHVHGNTLSSELFLDYSRYTSELSNYAFANQSLDELNLNESNGAGFPQGVGFSFPYDADTYLTIAGTQPIDWNQDSSINNNVTADINQHRPGEFLKSYSDWSNLQFGVSTVHDASTGGLGADGELPACTGLDGGSQLGLWECNNELKDAEVVEEEKTGDAAIDVHPTIENPDDFIIDVDWFKFDFDWDGIVEVFVDAVNELTIEFFDEGEHPVFPVSVSDESLSVYRFFLDYSTSNAESPRYMRISSDQSQNEFTTTAYHLDVSSPRPAETFTWTGAACPQRTSCDWRVPTNWSRNGIAANTSPTDGAKVVFPNLGSMFEVELHSSSVVIQEMSVDGEYRLFDGTVQTFGPEFSMAVNGVVELGVDFSNDSPVQQSGNGKVIMDGIAGVWSVVGAGTLAGTGAFADLSIANSATLAPGPDDVGQTGTMIIDGSLDVAGTILLDLVLEDESQHPANLVQGDLQKQIDNFQVSGSVFLSSSQLDVVTIRHKRNLVGNQSISFLNSTTALQNSSAPGVEPGHLGNGVSLQQVISDPAANALMIQFYVSVPGDSNLDGAFDSGDLVRVFASGEYEDNVDGNSTWEDGDWNGDGDFDSSDLIVAFVGGYYNLGPVKVVPLWSVREREERDLINKKRTREPRVDVNDQFTQLVWSTFCE